MKLDGLDLGPTTVEPRPLGYAVWPDRHEIPFYTRAQATALGKKRRSVETTERYDPITVAEIHEGNIHWWLPDIKPPYYLIGEPLTNEVVEHLRRYLVASGLKTVEAHQRTGGVAFLCYERRTRLEDCLPLLRWASHVHRVAADVLMEGLDL